MQLSDEVRALLRAPNLAHVAVLTDAGDVHSTPVWIGIRDGRPAVNTAVGRLLERRLRVDPRITVSVHSQEDPYTFVQLRGTAELIEEGAWDHLDQLAQDYVGSDYPVSREGMERVIVSIEPLKIFHRPPPSYDRPRWAPVGRLPEERG